MSIMTDPKLGVIPGPVHNRLVQQSRSMSWYNWAGYAAPSILESVEFEYFALRNQASLFDISPMHKYRIRGSDSSRMLNRMVTRDVSKILGGKVGYVLWCDEEGMVIDDGTLFHLADNDWRLCCQEPMLDWLMEAGWGFDVKIEDESHIVAGLALQGPTSFSILKNSGFDIDYLKPFETAHLDNDLMISRTGFTGDLGYELWMPWENAIAVWDRVWDGGQHLGLRAIGYEAVNIARIEAGYVTAGVDFQPVHGVERLHRGSTPFELGYGRMVDFGKGHFNGRRALLSANQAPRSLLLRLDVEGFKPANGSLIYHRKRREVGHVTSGIWSPTAKRNIALAHVKTPWATTGSKDLWAEVYTLEEGRWDTRMAKVSPATQPFYAPERAKMTPPGRK